MLPAFKFVSFALLVRRVFSADYTTSNTTTPHDNSPDCNCYVVQSGLQSNRPEFFQYYRFFDFRNLASGPRQYTNTPPRVNNSQNAGQEDVWQPNIFNGDAWNTDWGIQDWTKTLTPDSPTLMVNSPANVYLGQNSDSKDPFTWLTLRTSRSADFQSASEIENKQRNLFHASLRMRSKVTGASGAVAGFFTFFDDSNESDIEVLTRDPKDVTRYTNQPSVDKDGNEIVQASQNPSGQAAWDTWQTHRIDWFEKESFWYMNGDQVAHSTYSVPRVPSGLIVNMWSDGGVWGGNMTVGDSAEFQILWIEMAFNTSGPVEGPAKSNGHGGKSRRSNGLFEKRAGQGCKTVCKIDGVNTTGTPEVVKPSKAANVAIPWASALMVGLVPPLIGL